MSHNHQQLATKDSCKKFHAITINKLRIVLHSLLIAVGSCCVAVAASDVSDVATVADVFDIVAANWFGVRASAFAAGSARIAGMSLRLNL